MLSKSTDALSDLNALKSMQPVKTGSNTVELYEIIFGADKTSLKLVTTGAE
jgi:hypothetical protein